MRLIVVEGERLRDDLFYLRVGNFERFSTTSHQARDRSIDNPSRLRHPKRTGQGK
jgi:hypothetical protein